MWKIGDLAAAKIAKGVWLDGLGKSDYNGPQPGGVYRVVNITTLCDKQHLAFAEFDPNYFYLGSYFRKIKPDCEGDKAEGNAWLRAVLSKREKV
jgi:hypothetical protein